MDLISTHIWAPLGPLFEGHKSIPMWTFESNVKLITLFFLCLNINYITTGKWLRNSVSNYLYSVSGHKQSCQNQKELSPEDARIKSEMISRIKQCVYLLCHHGLTTLLMLPIIVRYLLYWKSYGFGCDNEEYLTNGWSKMAIEVQVLILGKLTIVITLEMLAYLCYTYQLAYYIHALMVDLFVKKERKKDFAVMVVHHIMAFTLILISSGYEELRRPGLVILFLHDSTDILLYVSKIFAYIDARFLSKFCFFFFSCSFIFVRLVFFPYELAKYEKQWGFVSPGKELSLLSQEEIAGLILPKVAHALLWLLIICHIYWTMTIFRICKSVYLKGNPLEDFRETQTAKKSD